MNETLLDLPDSSSSQNAFIFDFTVSDSAVQDLGVGILDFQLVGKSSSVYSSTSVLAETIFNTVFLDPAQKASGQIAFLIPKTDSPSTLEFIGKVRASDGSLPAPSANVSEIMEYGASLTGSEASQVQVNGEGDVNFSSHTQGYWYSGDIIGVNISLGFSLQYSGNGSDIYKVTPINDTDGLQIVGYSPTLPMSFGEVGSYVTVWVRIPQDSYVGNLNFVINVS